MPCMWNISQRSMYQLSPRIVNNWPLPGSLVHFSGNFTSTAHVIAMITTRTVLIENVYSCFILDRYKLSSTQHTPQFFIAIISTQSNSSLSFLVLMMLAPGDLVGSSKNAPRFDWILVPTFASQYASISRLLSSEKQHFLVWFNGLVNPALSRNLITPFSPLALILHKVPFGQHRTW